MFKFNPHLTFVLYTKDIAKEGRMRILLCEDEKSLNKLIKQRLVKEGYAVDACYDGMEGLEYIKATSYDLILLDIMMPKLDGLGLLTQMRKNGVECPVLFLTAKDSSEDIVRGLDKGANDYIVKPFVFEELLARIRVVLRTKPKQKNSIIKISDLELDINKKRVTRAGILIKLTLKEYSILEYMMLHQNQILTKEQIEESIWSYDFDGEGGLVKVYISYLRKKIDGTSHKKLIHTVRGLGYMIRGDENEA